MSHRIAGERSKFRAVAGAIAMHACGGRRAARVGDTDATRDEDRSRVAIVQQGGHSGPAGLHRFLDDPAEAMRYGERSEMTNQPCSFCGQPHTATFESSGTRICDPCIGLCGEILAEHVGLTIDADIPGSQLSRAWIDDVIARLDRRPILEDARCSFCNGRSDDVVALIAGPRVFICEACVANAIAHVGRHGA